MYWTYWLPYTGRCSVKPVDPSSHWSQRAVTWPSGYDAWIPSVSSQVRVSAESPNIWRRLVAWVLLYISHSIIFLPMRLGIRRGLVVTIHGSQAWDRRFKTAWSPQAWWPGRYINVRRCGGRAVVPLQLKDPLGTIREEKGTSCRFCISISFVSHSFLPPLHWS